MPDQRKTRAVEDRTEAASQIKAAIEHWGFSGVEVDADNPTTLYATLRSAHTSRTFTATILVVEAKEV